MSRRNSLGTQIKSALLWRYKLTPLDMGEDARLSKNGMVFDTESYLKTGRNVSGRLSQAAADYISIFEAQLHDAETCDREAKTAKVREFTDTLISDGGVAVNQMTKLFGRETAERVIRRHMYGV